MTKSFRASAAAAALAAIVGWTFAGHAEGSAASAEDIATARSLAMDGVKLSEDGNCAGAIEKFQKAEALYHTPSVLQRLGECQIKLGKLVAGTETLNRVVREVLPANAPAPFVQAQARAKELLDKTLPRIGKLKLHVDAPEGAQLTLKIDGSPVSVASLDTDRASDPGKHVVEVSAPGYPTVTGEVTVGEGASATLSLKVEREKPKAKPDEPEPVPTKVKPKPVGDDDGEGEGEDEEESTPAPRKKPIRAVDGESRGPSRVAPIIMFATAGVGIAVGTVFGLRANAKKSDLDAVCLNKACPSSADSDISGMKTDATVSTVGFGIGVAAVAIGTILWFTAGGEEPKPGQAYVRPMLGLGFVGVRGAL